MCVKKDFFNKNAYDIPQSGIREFFDIASKNKNCISLALGESNLGCQRHIAMANIVKNSGKYTQNAGIYPLRKLISQLMRRYIGVEYNADNEIIVTVGASEGIDISLRAIINAGDEVLLPTPAFVSYAPLIRLAGGIPVEATCTRQDNFKLTKDALLGAITSKTKALILSYPNNPTGAIMTLEDLIPIARIAEENDIIVISDEIYSMLIYDEKFVSIASIGNMRERTIIVSGFSKCFSMTGFRIGYVCAPKEIAKIAYKIHQYCVMCAPTISQNLATNILARSLQNNFSQTRKLLEKCSKNRDFLIKRLCEIGLDCLLPQGTFYAFPSVKAYDTNGRDFAYSLLKEKDVAIIPGDTFSSHTSEHVRLNFATPTNILDKALERIEEFCKELNTKSK